jgi:aspartate 1-decarboxylase
MLIPYLKAKIHRATVTDANLHYTGSISIDPKLLTASGIRPFEKVEIYNLTNGERFATYVISGKDGEICLNGAAAWKARAKDMVIIASYCLVSPEEAKTLRPNLVFVDEANRIQSIGHGDGDK